MEPNTLEIESPEPLPRPPTVKDRYWLHALLFILTLISTTVTWVLWSPKVSTWASFFQGPELITGMLFAICLIGFLTVHEFGHYFAAKHHRISASLPYFIPLPFLAIGTLGAVISIREPLPDKTRLLDIGAAGPLAGFAVALVLTLVAFTTMPGPEAVLEYEGHYEIKEHITEFGTYPDEMPESQVGAPVVGNTILFWAMTHLFPNTPPPYELYHDPLLFSAWLALFFTALNLLPVGQLDGGHITYALFGAKWHGRIARAFIILLLTSAAVGVVNGSEEVLLPYLENNGPIVWICLSLVLYLFMRKVHPRKPPTQLLNVIGIIAFAALSPRMGSFAMAIGHSGWLIWSLLLVLVIKIDHPPVFRPGELSRGRQLVAILCILIFFLCFSVRPFYLAT